MILESTKVPIPLLNTSIEGEVTGPYMACSVAKFLVGQNVPDLGTTKQIKLVYISHGWFLGLLERPLIEETVEVWENGPVIRELYDVIKDARSQHGLPDPEKLRKLLEEYPAVDRDSIEADLISLIADKYGDYDGKRLRELTRTKNSPWNYAIATAQLVVKNGIIQAYYRTGLEIDD